jgi:hypothetical protein
MGQKMVRFGALRGTRSRQDESIEVGEVGSKRPSLGGNEWGAFRLVGWADLRLVGWPWALGPRAARLLRIGLGAHSPVSPQLCIKRILSKKIGSADSPPPWRWPPVAPGGGLSWEC